VKGTHLLIGEGELEEAEAMAAKAIKTLDKAAAKGILHRRNVDRRKSRLMKAINSAKKAAA
jgi:small subunit ribosomal protein S20